MGIASADADDDPFHSPRACVEVSRCDGRSHPAAGNEIPDLQSVLRWVPEHLAHGFVPGSPVAIGTRYAPIQAADRRVAAGSPGRQGPKRDYAVACSPKATSMRMRLLRRFS